MPTQHKRGTKPYAFFIPKNLPDPSKLPATLHHPPIPPHLEVAAATERSSSRPFIPCTRYIKISRPPVSRSRNGIKDTATSECRHGNLRFTILSPRMLPEHPPGNRDKDNNKTNTPDHRDPRMIANRRTKHQGANSFNNMSHRLVFCKRA